MQLAAGASVSLEKKKTSAHLMEDEEAEEASGATESPRERYLVGGNLGFYAPAFSSDGHILFCCVSFQIKMFSVSSGEQLGTLRGHSKNVTNIIINPHNRLQLFSCSLDGMIKKWDYCECICLESYSIGFPITQFAICGDVFVCNLDNDLKSSSRVITYPVSGGTAAVASVIYKSRFCKGLAVSPGGKFVATISKATITLCELQTNKRTKYTHTKLLTAIAFHPTEPYFATGDIEGQIIFWYRFEEPEKLVTSSLHWHAHGVESLAFSEDGAYLLSGGEEAVLVMWQLGTGNRQFLPRLGSTLTHISVSPNGNLYALACADSSIRVVSSITTRVERHLRGLQHAHSHHVPESARILRTGLVREPRNSYLVLHILKEHSF